jgi:hypothetical protein
MRPRALERSEELRSVTERLWAAWMRGDAALELTLEAAAYDSATLGCARRGTGGRGAGLSGCSGAA